MKRLLLTFALLLLSTAAFSENRGGRLGVWDSENRHSLSLSVGFAPCLFGYYTSLEYSNEVHFEIPERNPNYYDYYSNKCFSLPAFSASYFYRIDKNFSVGCSVGYGYESNEYNLWESDEYAFTSRDNIFFITPTARLHWLNSNALDMYSGVGIIGYGVGVTTNAERVEGYRKVTQGISMQVTLVGLNAKFNRTYIFSELGVGTFGIFRFGAGYRF